MPNPSIADTLREALADTSMGMWHPADAAFHMRDAIQSAIPVIEALERERDRLREALEHLRTRSIETGDWRTEATADRALHPPHEQP